MNDEKQKELFNKLIDKLELPPNTTMKDFFEKTLRRMEQIKKEAEEDKQEAKEVIDLVNEVMAPVVSQMYELLQLIDGLSEEELKALEELENQEEREPITPAKKLGFPTDNLYKMISMTPEAVLEKAKVQKKGEPSINIVKQDDTFTFLNARTGKTKGRDGLVVLSYGLEERFERVTSFDKCVLRVVGTLYQKAELEEREPCYTLNEICAHVMGKANAKPYEISVPIKQAVYKSLLKLRELPLTINLTEDTIVDKLADDGFDDYIDGLRFLDFLRRRRKTTKGTYVDVFYFESIPFLYKLSQYRNAIKQLPIEVFALTNSRAKIETKVSLRDFLVSRIENMKQKDFKSRTILFETLVIELDLKEDYDLTNKSKKQNLKKLIETDLDHLKQVGYIKDYSYSKKGKINTGVKIFLYEDERKKKRTKK